MCAATAISPPTLFQHSGEGNPELVLQVRGAKPGFLGAIPRETFCVDRASVCLQCGHVILGFSPQRLQQLRERLPSLDPET
jgi:hypothetical protein